MAGQVLYVGDGLPLLCEQEGESAEVAYARVLVNHRDLALPEFRRFCISPAEMQHWFGDRGEQFFLTEKSMLRRVVSQRCDLGG